MEPKVNYTEKEYRTFMRQMGFRVPRKTGVPPWVVVVLSGALCTSLVVSTARYSALSKEYAELEEKCVQAQNAAEENYSDYKRTKQEYNSLLEEKNKLQEEYDVEVSTSEWISDQFYTLLHYCTGENPNKSSATDNFMKYLEISDKVSQGIYATTVTNTVSSVLPVTETTKKTFRIGSTQQDVIDAMGMPDDVEVWDYLCIEWYYGTSMVEFNYKTGLVQGWETGNTKLPLG